MVADTQRSADGDGSGARSDAGAAWWTGSGLRPSVVRGGISGAVATAAMGVAITVVDLATLRVAIAGLYGLSGSLFAGWVAHLFHGTLFGVLFALVLTDPALARLTDWNWKTTLAGTVYGLVLFIAGAGLIMPMWLSAVGFASPPPLPNFTAGSLVWHVIYGVVLGGLYAALPD